MTRTVVVLDDGDVAAIVFDEEIGRLEIYDELPTYEIDLFGAVNEIGTPLIQAQLSDSTRLELIRALGGVPPEEN